MITDKTHLTRRANNHAMNELAYIDGRFIPLNEAKVSITDRGFVFGDGVYEVIAAYNRQAFRLEEHLARLGASANAISLVLPLDNNKLKEIIGMGLAQSNSQTTQIYVQVTRGSAPRSHAFPAGITSNLVVTFRPLVQIPENISAQGVSVITTEEIRWDRCNIKSISLLPNVLAKQKATEQGVFEAIWVTKDGVVNEGAASNIFVIREGEMHTPPKNEKILGGITRDVVLQCAQGEGMLVYEIPLQIEKMLQADEIFLTSTTIEILGVVDVDGQKIGEGTVGPITKQLSNALRQEIDRATSQSKKENDRELLS